MGETGYNLKNIRILLTEGFTRDELVTLCFDEPTLRPIYEGYSEESGTGELARRIVDYAHKKLVMEVVLDWTKEHNPLKFKEMQPYVEPEVSGASHVRGEADNREVGLVLRGNDLGNGLTLGGMYQGIRLRIAATAWAEYGTSGWVRSGWLFIPQWTVSHAVAFFKVHISEDGTGYIHIVDVSDPMHTIWLTTRTGWKKEDKFDYNCHSADLWRFSWRE